MFERVFFVLSPSYHGATLLAKLINAHPRVTALGDTMPSNRFDQICGCGQRVSRCRFWQAVKADTRAGRYTDRCRRMLPQYPGELGGRLKRLAYSDFTSFWATPGVLRRVHRTRTLQTFRDDFQAFLRSLHRHTDEPGGVFVDGVKFASRVSALQAAGQRIDGVIHLYREPVQFVASSVRNTGRGGRRHLLEHALRYRAYHARARQVARHAESALVLHYERLAEDLDGELARLFVWLGLEPMTVAELREYFDREWHFMGNASLFSFDGAIRPSRYELPRRDRRWITAVAGH